MSVLDGLMDWLDSDEAKENIDNIIKKITDSNKIRTNQINRLYETGQFVNFTKRVIKKYENFEYQKRWYDRNIEPPYFLYWFLFDYAKEYGRECNMDEWVKYSNIFTTELYVCDPFIFERMDGQGSVIKIMNKINDYV